MNDLPGNQNYEEAERFVNEASERNNFHDTERAIIAKNGLTLATLALAYEQRTANLLHAFEISLRAQSSGFNVDAKTIDARLGLTEGATK